MAKLKIGMIGAGNIANAHLDAYKKYAPDAEIVAICDINEERLNETADIFGIEKRYLTVDEMLANETLDAADVCVWNINHAECTIKALNAGLNVMCEKPMAYNAKQAEEMIEAAKKNNKLLMIGFVCRFSNETAVLKDYIDNGYLGNIYYSKACYTRDHGCPNGWFSDKSLSGGGPVIDLGVHVIDQTRYLMGNPKPVSVYAATYNKLLNRPDLKTSPGWMPKGATTKDKCDVEDLGVALIKYDNGATTLLEASYSLNGKPSGLKALYGDKGGAEIDEVLKLYTPVNGYMSEITPDTNKLNFKKIDNMFGAEVNHFVDCCLNGTECIATAEDGLVIMKILDAIYKSAETGHEVLL